MSAPPTTSAAPRSGLVVLALLLVYVVWGSTYLPIKWALVGFPPFGMAAIRFAAAGGLFYGWLRWR